MKGANNEETQEFLESKLALFSKMAGGVAGVAVGAVLSPLVGAAIAPFVATSLERLGSEFIERQLGSRQRMRIGAFVVLAHEELQQRISRGEHLRQDDFFNQTKGGRSAAEEISEAHLDAAMKAFEEKKLPFLAKLLANICFTANVDRAMAHMLIDIASRVSFRSLVLLKIASEIDKFKFPERTETGKEPSMDSTALMTEIFGLIQSGLIQLKKADDDKNPAAIFGLSGVHPALMRLDGVGLLLYRLMGLADIDFNDDTYCKTVELLHVVALISTEEGHTIDGGNY